jgi:lactate permease
MVGRQLPFIALIVPFYVIGIYGGRRSIAALWPMLLVAGGSFALLEYFASNFADYRLTDILSSLGSLIITILFLRTWRPAPDPKYALRAEFHAEAAATGAAVTGAATPAAAWQGWLPWLLVSAVVIGWTFLKIFTVGDVKIPWPGLDNAVFITLYNHPYAAVWDFQPLATGTAILFASVLTAAFVGVDPRGFIACARRTWGQVWIAVITVALVLGLAYLMNYSGMTYTLGKGVASLGILFPLASALLGWVGGFLTGSDTSANALFGNLQVVASNQLQLNPILFAATNDSGGALGKMISPQNLTTAVSVSDLKGKEGVVFARTFVHSIALTVMLCILVVIQQFLIPGIIPR